MTTRIDGAGRGSRAARALRGTGAAAVATFVATASHAAVTGAAPGAPNLLLALALAAPICVALTGRTPSWWRLSVTVVLSQVLFHSFLALDLTGGSTAAASTLSTGMPHHGATATLTDAAAHAAPSSAVALSHGADSPWMWASHALAALITIVALGTGERALRAIAAVIADTFRALVPFQTARPTTVARAQPAPVLLTAGIAVLSVMRRRGPPLAV